MNILITVRMYVHNKANKKYNNIHNILDQMLLAKTVYMYINTKYYMDTVTLFVFASNNCKNDTPYTVAT